MSVKKLSNNRIKIHARPLCTLESNEAVLSIFIYVFYFSSIPWFDTFHVRCNNSPLSRLCVSTRSVADRCQGLWSVLISLRSLLSSRSIKKDGIRSSVRSSYKFNDRLRSSIRTMRLYYVSWCDPLMYAYNNFGANDLTLLNRRLVLGYASMKLCKNLCYITFIVYKIQQSVLVYSSIF